MITEIYIEDNRLDLSKDLSNEYTYAIDDITDFASRNTNFSKTIILPGNAVNNKLFGHIFEFNSSNFYNALENNVGYNFNASKSASCVIYIDKIQIFKGIIRLLEITIDRGTIEYECVVFGELGGFVNAIGNKKLEELDFSAYDHVWNYENIANSWEQASGNTASGYGYYYPLIDYGQVSHGGNANFPKRDWNFKAFRPAMFVREYLEKIISGANYTYESNFFSTDFFKRLIIPNNQKDVKKFTSLGLSAAANVDQYNSSAYVVWTPLTLGNFTINAPDTIFTYSSATSFTGTLSLTLFGQILTTGTIFSIELIKDGVAIYNYIGDPVGGSYFDVNVQITNQTFSQNQTLYVNINTDVEQYTIDDGSLTFESTTPQFVNIGYNDTISINDTLPKGIFQRDFVASVIKLFNLYIVEDSINEKHLKIEPFVDFYTGTFNFLQIDDLENNYLIDNVDLLLLDDEFAQHLDWSYKVDRSKAIKITPMGELNGRYFEYKYKSDNDYYNEDYNKRYNQTYGDYIEDTGFEFSVEKQTAEIIFSPTVIVGYEGEDKHFSTIFKLTNTQNTKSEDIMESNIRILQARKITGVHPWHIRNGNSNVTPGGGITYYGYAGHLDNPDIPTSDLNFGVPKELYFTLTNQYPSANMYNAFWSSYIAEITDKDSKLLTCYIYLKLSDIFSLDFSKLIYIDGSLWRLNKVVDYNPTSPASTKCEFLKVIELTYA
jgi:hypothetical protein